MGDFLGSRSTYLGLVFLALGMFDGQVSSGLLQYDVVSLLQVLLFIAQRIQLTVQRLLLLRQPNSDHPPAMRSNKWETRTK